MAKATLAPSEACRSSGLHGVELASPVSLPIRLLAFTSDPLMSDGKKVSAEDSQSFGLQIHSEPARRAMQPDGNKDQPYAPISEGIPWPEWHTLEPAFLPELDDPAGALSHLLFGRDTR